MLAKPLCSCPYDTRLRVFFFFCGGGMGCCGSGWGGRLSAMRDMHVDDEQISFFYRAMVSQSPA